MGEFTNYLITVLSGRVLLKCALKVPNELLTNDQKKYPLEKENCVYFQSLLPLHIINLGPIVDIQEIFEIHILSKQSDLF